LLCAGKCFTSLGGHVFPDVGESLRGPRSHRRPKKILIELKVETVHAEGFMSYQVGYGFLIAMERTMRISKFVRTFIR